MSFQDKTLRCHECQDSFVFTVGEQEFHASKGFQNEPGRCPSCRAARKQNNPGRSTSESSGGGGGAFSGFERQMHDAVCAECGRNTQVPFVPSGSRPVYCRDCYSRQPAARSKGSSSSYSGRSRY